MCGILGNLFFLVLCVKITICISHGKQEIKSLIALFCKSELRKTEEEPEYWMCDKCIKGFNREELKGARKKDAEVQEEDNAPNGL